MISIRPHSAEDYKLLPDIDAPGISSLAPDDERCLDEIGEYLISAGLNYRFGVPLLHSHFPIFDGELMVEIVDRERGCVRLLTIEGAGDGLVVTNAQFVDDKGISLTGLQYVERGALGDVPPLGPQDEKACRDIAAILGRHGKLGRFGLRLLHDPLALNGRVLMETCDMENRVLTLRITPAEDLRFKKSVPTVFEWEVAREGEADDRTVRMYCNRKCFTETVCEYQGSNIDASGARAQLHIEKPPRHTYRWEHRQT